MRPLADGDRIPEVERAAAPPEPGDSSSPPVAPPLVPEPPAEVVRLPRLPDGFLDRVRALSPQTLLHIPHSVRARMCEVTATLVEGCNANATGADTLEQARSKLLLAHIPKGRSQAHELRARLALWAGADFLQLLERVEAQGRAHRASQRASRKDEAGMRAARGRRMARGGAYRKAVQAQLVEAAAFSPEDERAWAQRLLPASERPAGERHEAAQPAVASPEGDDFNPMEGVRFAVLSAPGPSGARPEHLRDMLGCGRRRVANRLLRALHVTETMAAAGQLPDAWRWMLGSRLVYIQKKRSRVPRPIRVGELWRRVVAKWLAHRHAPRVRRVMLESHQYAVSVPGGADVLIHARRTFRESVVHDAGLGVWAEVDVDFVNAFPSLGWEAIDHELETSLPALAPWGRWCHESAVQVGLPNGGWHRCD